MRRIVIAACFLVIGLVVAARSEIAPQSKEDLLANATEIVLGSVKRVYTDETRDGNWRRIEGVVELEVTRVEKGDACSPGRLVYARFWNQRWIGKGNPPPHGSGHHVPSRGTPIRAYLESKEGGFDVLLPNGFEIVAKPASAGAKPPASAQ